MARVIKVTRPSIGISDKINNIRNKHKNDDNWNGSLDELMLKIIANYNSKDKLPWVQSLDRILLEILRKYNFPSNHPGTDCYITILRRIILFLIEATSDSDVRSKKEELETQLLNPYSQFYLDIVYDMACESGLKTFHEHINDATEIARKMSKARHQDHFEQRRYKEVALGLSETIYTEIKKGNIIVEDGYVDTKSLLKKIRSRSILTGKNNK